MVVERDAFRAVYAVLIHSEKPGIDDVLLRKCIDIAAKNKVLLHFLRVLDIRDDTRLSEEAEYRRFLRDLYMVAETLDGLNHVFIKLRKPVAYVPSDIDVLIARSHIVKAVARLRDRGFRIEVVEPYCITMVRGGCIVDLYVYPTIGGMVYLDAVKLMEHVERISFNSLEMPVLKTYAEALMTIAHAVYKERIYTLNDYIAVRTWLSEKTLRLAEELRCLDAVNEALAIHRLVEEHGVVLPYRIPFAKWVNILRSKILRDELSRATLLNVFKTPRDLRFGKLVVSKLARETY